MKIYALLLLLLLAVTADARKIHFRRRSSSGGNSFRWNVPSSNDMLADQIKQTGLQKDLLIKRRELEQTKETIEHQKKIERLKRQKELLLLEKQIRDLQK